MPTDGPMRVRVHGATGPTVIVLHGGPAGVGSAGPIAAGLAHAFHVLEPWQRGSGDEPLTVARYVTDLDEVVRTSGADPPALVGESWGAMLALAYAADHPDRAGPIVLVGCGTFDPVARQRLHDTIAARIDDDRRRRLDRLDAEIDDPARRLMARYDLIRPLYDYDVVEPPPDPEADAEPFDERAHRETWQDMLRCQSAGLYPTAFTAITSPVLMLHGDHDPHPGRLIRDSLCPFIPHLKYHELRRCGHRPWLERCARAEFFAILRRFLLGH